MLKISKISSSQHTKQQVSQRGFTLVELLVALVVMALLALLSWRGLDGMTRVQSQTKAYTDGVLALQAGLAQWQTDLDAVTVQANVPGVTGLDYDGQVLRLTRRYAENTGNTNNGSTGNSDSIRVVAWSQRGFEGESSKDNANANANTNNKGTKWLRWQSEPVKNRAELEAAWLQAKHWASNATEADKKGEVVVASIDAWQIFYYRNDAWSNALSSADAAGVAGLNGPTLPEGIRLVLTLSSGQALVGNITRDWVQPSVGGGKG
jgi:general secretion pathway protein J